MCCAIPRHLLRLAEEHGYLVQVSELECGAGVFHLSSEKVPAPTGEQPPART